MGVSQVEVLQITCSAKDAPLMSGPILGAQGYRCMSIPDAFGVESTSLTFFVYHSMRWSDRARRRAKSVCAGSSQHRPFRWFIPDMSEPSLEITCMRSSSVDCMPAGEDASCSDFEHEVGVLVLRPCSHAHRVRISGDGSGDGSGRMFGRILWLPTKIEPSLMHGMFWSAGCLRFQFAFCASLQSSPILGSRSTTV